MPDAANTFLRESRMSGYPAAAFDKVGDAYAGTVTNQPHVIENQFGQALVIELANPAYAEGGVTLFVKQGQMASAIADACGDHGLTEGGKLMLTLTDLRDTGKGNPLKVYEARYEPPVAKVDVSSLFGDR
jgi:hypothetical protein